MTSPRRNRKPAREDHATTEYRAASVPAPLLTDRDLSLLGQLSRDGVLTCRPTPDGYELDAESHVGVLTLDQVRLELRPKFGLSGEQLITWLAYALGFTPYRLQQHRGWHTAPGGLTDLVVAALVDECRHLIRQGLRRDYRREDRVEPVLRGRLDLRAQVSRRYGMVDQLHLRTFDRRVEVWENEVLHAALHAGARLARDPMTARLAAETAHAFPAHRNGVPMAVQALRRATYHRMNEAYRPAHAWAALLLGAGGPSDLLLKADAQAGSLLINMNRLWEAIVRRMITDAIQPHGSVIAPRGEHALTVSVQGEYDHTLRPDVLVRYPADGTILPIDAKYKRALRTVIRSDDLHQLLTYATAYPMPAPPRALVLHPSEAGWTRQWVSVSGPRGHLGDVLVVGIDIQRHPDDTSEQLQADLNLLLARHA